MITEKEIIKKTEELIFEKLDTIISYYGDREIDYGNYERQCKEEIKEFAKAIVNKIKKGEK